MSEHEFWKDLGNIFDAVLDYQKRNVEFNNRFINPWIRLGNIFDREDQTNDAVQAYQRATELDPDNIQNWIDLGDTQFKKGAYDEAIDAYGKAVTLDPEAGWPLGNLALCLMTQGKIEESIPVYQKSIDLLVDVKDKAICWNRLGNAYRKLNDYENAFLAFQKADQLDGENTGFNDTLDETQLNTSMVAPEEILEQMIVEQTLEEDEAESTASETASESVEEIPQLEVEPTTLDASQMEIADESFAIGPNMAMKIEEIVEEALTQSLKEADGKKSNDQNVTTDEEETPIALHEKKFDVIQVVESVIAKIEQALVEQKSKETENGSQAEEVSPETELLAVSEEAAQEQEIEAATETSESVPDVKTPVMSKEVSLEVEVQVVVEETILEVEAVAVESTEETNEATFEVETPITSEDAPRAVPSWLVIHDTVKTEEKEIVMKTKGVEENLQSESITTLSDIPQETIVSESVVSMNIVETYTDPLASQLTMELTLSDESVQETIDQADGSAEQEAPVEAADEVSEAETIPLEEIAVVEEVSKFLTEGEATELAYEEYLKDIVEPTNILTDHVDEIQSEAPITKVSKNGEVRIVMDTRNAHVWNELGNIYLNAGACDDSIASYSKAIELDRNFAWPYSNLALAYVQKGRFAEAILLYQRGIELFTSDKDKAITWNRLGNVYRRINDYSNAIAAYQTADELDPENATLSLRASFGLLGNMYSDSKPAYTA